MAYNVDKRGGGKRSQLIRANRPRVQRAQRAVQWQGINCPSGRAIAPEFSRGANATTVACSAKTTTMALWEA